MKRFAVLLLCIFVGALALLGTLNLPFAAAQGAATPIPTLPPPELLPPVVTEEFVAPVDGSGDPVPDAPTPEAASALGIEQTEALPIITAALNDINLLATEALGGDLRPVGWTGSRDVTDPNLPILLRLDLELLAGAVLGAEVRPDDWFGVVASMPIAVARDIRHDLELLADIVIGAQGIRPAGWQGDDPIYRCSRATQALYSVFQRDGLTIEIDFTQPNYCDAAENAATRYVERTIVQPPAAVSLQAAGVDVNRLYPNQVDSPFVAAFADRHARQKVGVVPVGTGYEPVARSYVDFSNMMMIRGADFQVFVDYTTTNVSYEQFLGLPNIGEGDPVITCNADWCGRNVD